MKKLRKPLTLSQLKAIQQRNLTHTDALTLLHEIKRLHGVLHNCWQVLDRVPSGPINSPLHLFKGLVDNEPCVKAQRAAYESFACIEQNKEQDSA